MQNILLKIFFIFLLFSTFNSLEEIVYSRAVGFIGRVFDRFSVAFNKKNGIKAEYEKVGDFGDIDYKPKGKKIYNLTNEEFGLPNMKELFKLFEKIDFPEKTDWMDETLFDVPIWHLIVDGKDYYSNVGTEFLSKIEEIVDVNEIKSYCSKNYDK